MKKLKANGQLCDTPYFVFDIRARGVAWIRTQ